MEVHFIGCDQHPRYQVVAWVNGETGEILKRQSRTSRGDHGRFVSEVGNSRPRFCFTTSRIRCACRSSILPTNVNQ